MITIEWGRIAEIREEGGALLRAHYEELTLHKEVVRLDPDWERYLELEGEGKLAILVMRKEGEMVGYSVFFLTRHLHYRGLFFAMNDVLFLREDLRGGMGLRLIRESEKRLGELGVKKIVWHAKSGTVLASLLPRLGYQVEDIALGKIVGA